ncbi:hypothetical protein [Capnocytophaga stomatis]|uniref:Uncharacterized protein n=2 Tax=Capnocytophaga stomatis TaxID=1848904 RepID=A0A250FWY0_9FLAO|nr:hypothetical protein [Capnocytophaga stomatis]ATA88496.1 hypothetical protein CGC58_01335 [Capnocytophaga stomatis]GIJ93210.1 hypothetical protein CAPN002_04280 [Capnocytophaga stomatis]GIJ96087.1 hypothetical protein CAPN001_06560 [Capnocytophaga stomatis]GIM50360.1 hypothetical protein CAPN003_18120 [Capnocytophaga stomatis]
MKNSKMNKKYLFAIIGFLAGVIFYLFGVMVSNSEVSSVAPTLSELLRNVDYVVLFLYGIIGFITLYILTTSLNKLIK